MSAHDAEDAFQATFLVLVQKGGTIRGRHALAGWLHQVAHGVAIRANVAAARRRALERKVGQLAVTTSMNGPAASDDLVPALHAEIARLPEKYRLAVVHCDLEGMPQAQAAGQLQWSERTLQPPTGRGAGSAQGADWPDAGWHPIARCCPRCSCATRGSPSRQLGAKRPFVPRSPQ